MTNTLGNAIRLDSLVEIYFCRISFKWKLVGKDGLFGTTGKAADLLSPLPGVSAAVIITPHRFELLQPL
jgi:hypothetical protein